MRRKRTRKLILGAVQRDVLSTLMECGPSEASVIIADTGRPLNIVYRALHALWRRRFVKKRKLAPVPVGRPPWEWTITEAGIAVAKSREAAGLAPGVPSRATPGRPRYDARYSAGRRDRPPK